MRRLLAPLHDLGLQLLALYVLLIVPFLITLLVFNQLVRVRIRENVENNDLSLTSAIAQETDTSISRSLKSVQALAVFPAVVSADPQGMAPVFSTMLATHPDVNLVYRLDRNGIMLYHYPVGPGSTVGVDFSFRDYFQRALDTREPLVSEGRVSPTTGQAVATAVMPLWSTDGQFLGLVGANITLESLSGTLEAILSEQQSKDGLQIAILDSSDQIIAYPDAALLLHPAGDLLPNMPVSRRAGQAVSFTSNAPGGTERLYTAAPIPGINWTVVVSRPTSVAFATQGVLERIAAVAAVTFILIGLFFWAVLSARVIRPIERLAPISEAIGANQTISVEARAQVHSIAQREDQIGHLVRSILRLEDAIADRMREQATLVETSAAVVSSLDSGVVLDRILEQLGRLLKVDRCAIIALDQERGVFRIRAARGLSQRYTEQLTIQPTEPDSVSMRALHAGEAIYVGDTETDPSYVNRRALARSEGYRAVMAVPLTTQHAPPTALVVFHSAAHEFTQNERQLLSTFANQASMAIENAVLFARSDMRLQEQTRRLEALMQSMGDGLILSDPGGSVVYANRRVADLSSLPLDELPGTPAQHVLDQIVLHASEPRTARRDVRRILQSKVRITEIALEREGQPLYLRLEAFDVTDARGTSIGHGLILRNVTTDRELDRMKSTLISTVSHELRTPLASIKGYATTLLADDVEWDPAAQREFLTIISDETDRLSMLVNNLLDLSRIEAGSLKLAYEECPPDEIVDRAAEQSRLQPGNHLEVRIDPDLPQLMADRPRLETILRNLIENAVKYGGTSATIRVAVTQSGGSLVFRITDDGPGIAPAEIDRIFESFYRVDNSLTRAASGAGLGLAICHGLVSAHGGRIWVEPQARGTCMAFSLPLKQRPARRTRRSPEREVAHG